MASHLAVFVEEIARQDLKRQRLETEAAKCARDFAVSLKETYGHELSFLRASSNTAFVSAALEIQQKECAELSAQLFLSKSEISRLLANVDELNEEIRQEQHLCDRIESEITNIKEEVRKMKKKTGKKKKEKIFLPICLLSMSMRFYVQILCYLFGSFSIFQKFFLTFFFFCLFF